MNRSQLSKLGVPDDCHSESIELVKAIAQLHWPKSQVESHISACMNQTDDMLKEMEAIPEDDRKPEQTAALNFMRALIEESKIRALEEPVPYEVWGRDQIDETSFKQMDNACRVPCAHRAAVMPDAHVGYGLPIGGVLALNNAVIPYAVGVDIACRMKMTVLDTPVEDLRANRNFDRFKESIEKGTRFGVGVSYGRSGRQNHDVMDDSRWGDLKLLDNLKMAAWEQLGTSGSGNHFAEFGELTVDERNELGLDPGVYVALLSHSGSRKAGATVCQRYSAIAKSSIPKKLRDEFGHLGWLDLDSEAGQEYWLAMNLMGDYASANHDVIHKNVAKRMKASVIAGVENHHNFAWLEDHDGKTVVVHRKGATPAGKGVLGVIPGSMGTPAYVVRGKGNEASLASASHGAGRLMSRTKAKDKYNFKAEKGNLEARGVRVLSAGADEVPGVYKNIDEVMAAQVDLVESIARFDPKIVKMSSDGKAED